MIPKSLSSTMRREAVFGQDRARENEAMTHVLSMFWCRSRWTRPIPTACRPGLELAPGDVVTVPLGARGETIGVVWAENPNPNPRLHNRMKDVVGKHDVPPLKPEIRQFVDWVSGYTLASRGMVLRMALRMGEHLGPARERVGVRLAGPPPARMTAARARALGLFADGLVRSKSEAAQEAGVSAGVIDGLIDEGTLETVVLPPEPVVSQPDPDFRKPEFSFGPTRRRRHIADDSHARRLHGHIAGWGHRLRQNGSLLRGRCRKHPAETADTDPDAGNCAHRAISRPLFQPFRHPAGGVALAAFTAQTRAHLGGDRRERGAGDCRRAVGAVPALRRPRPHCCR